MIGLYYYAGVARQMWFEPPPDGDRTPVRVQPAVALAIGGALVLTLLFGVAPGTVTHFGHAATDLIAAGR